MTNKKRCSWRPVTGGLPQKTILEPRITYSLTIYTTEYTHGKFDNNTKLEGMADTPDGHATIQADVDRLKKQTNENLMKFNRKCQVLHPRRNNPKHQNLGQPLGKQFRIKGLGQGKPTACRTPLNRVQPAGGGGDPSLLLSTGDIPSAVMCPVLWFPV